MSTHKYIDRICYAVLTLTLLATVFFMNARVFGVETISNSNGYESRLFDTSRVHTIDIVMDDWEGFLDACTSEEYSPCSVIIDNKAYKNVAIRAKGNTSLTQVASYGNDRYSFKIEFDHYDSAKAYYGLDKLSLNNIIQDNTYMKDYLCYQMMGYFGVDAPLCSYVQVLVNGEEWGLYLAVEGIEEAFLERNFGSDYGELYKPDSQSIGGGPGNGGKFNMDDWSPEENRNPTGDGVENQDGTSGQSQRIQPDGQEWPEATGQNQPDGQDSLGWPANMGGSMGSSDVSLIYSGDDYDNYSNIFDSAKTNITDADKDRLIASLKQLNEKSNIENVVDVDAVIRYFVVHNFVCNFDSYTGSMIHNYYLYEKAGQLSMIPWDYNLAFGGFVGGSDATSLVNFPIDTPVSGGTVDSRPMLAWILADEEYKALYHSYFSEFISDYFDSGAFTEQIDAVRKLISPCVNSDPTKFCTYEEFEAGVDTLKEFCLLRAKSVAGQLDCSIPSTSDDQAQDASTLIDASGISISDMGTMNGQGGGMGNAMRPDGQNGGMPPSNQDGAPPDLPSDDDRGQQEKTGSPPQKPDGTISDNDSAAAPSSEVPSATPPPDAYIDITTRAKIQQTSEGNPWLLLGSLTLVLVGGLLFALLYKKRS